MMNQLAAFLWSLLTVFLAGSAIFLDPLWIVDVGMVGRILAVIIWLFLLMALVAGSGKGWGLRYGVGLMLGAALTYAEGGLMTLYAMWFAAIAAWWRLMAVTADAMAAIGISEGPGVFG